MNGAAGVSPLASVAMPLGRGDGSLTVRPLPSGESLGARGVALEQAFYDFSQSHAVFHFSVLAGHRLLQTVLQALIDWRTFGQAERCPSYLRTLEGNLVELEIEIAGSGAGGYLLLAEIPRGEGTALPLVLELEEVRALPKILSGVLAAVRGQATVPPTGERPSPLETSELVN